MIYQVYAKVGIRVMKNKKYQRTPVKRKSRKPLYIVLLLLFVIAIGIYVAYRHFHHPSTTQHAGSAGQATKGQPKQSTPTTTGQSNPSTSSSNNSSKNTGTPAPQPTAKLLPPTGNFVSNHHVSLSNSASNNITSVCTTTPGATCKITFTNGGTVKSLPEEVTDANGSAYWNRWTLQQYGITQGSWKITAIATLGTQTQSADDQLNLEVAP